MYNNKTNLRVYLDIWRIRLAVSVAMMLARLAFESEVALCIRHTVLPPTSQKKYLPFHLSWKMRPSVSTFLLFDNDISISTTGAAAAEAGSSNRPTDGFHRKFKKNKILKILKK